MSSNYKKCQELVSSVKGIKKRYDKERDKDRFNIFYALHKWNDEVNLHSRFISYLLANNSGHGKGNLFAKLFLDIIYEDKRKPAEEFFVDYEVIPNEYNKTEFEEIDILLVNRRLSQSHAVIIENKIFAKDSNHDGKDDGYNGQLERYYNTIKKGKYLEKDKIVSHKYICKKIDVFYLSLKPPKESFIKSKGETLKNEFVKELRYEYTIIPWIENCLKKIEDSFLKKTINQYLILVKNMTNTNVPREERNALRKVFSNDLKTSKYIIDNFKHIKWHTVADFLNLLESTLKEKYGKKNVYIYPKDEEKRHQLITELTHDNKNINIGVKFQNSKEEYYISTLNNLSWGSVETKEWRNFKSSAKLENIRFSEFSNENTYDLIKKENMEDVVNQIVEEILKEITVANKS